ncbi:DEP domain-containing protein 7-like [Aulostomus maculatus]
MASIKERAAALNLAEKLRVRSPAHGEASKPVQSSSWCSGLISHLRFSLKVRRHRIHLKSHNDCFLGSEAADVVAEHMNGVQAFEGASASRDKVVWVCQALLDYNVFEAVGTKVFGKDRKADVFQDSKSALYRFANTSSVDESELLRRFQKIFSSASSDRQRCPTWSHDQMSNPVKVIQPSITVNQPDTPVSASLSLETMVDSLSPTRVQTDSSLPQSLSNEVWKEQTLLRLLNIVELPLLEGVLQCSQMPSSSPPLTPLAHRNPDLIYSSNHLDRQILKAFRDSQEDKWLCAALDCLDFLPDQPVVNLSRELPYCFPQDQPGSEPTDRSIPDSADNQRGVAECKQLLYGTLVKHYSSTDRPPLLPNHMTDIYTAIIDLLVNAKLGTALEALQLCLKLLPPSCREELRRLLVFMALAADAQGIQLEKEMENRLAVKRSFSRAILHSKALSKEKEDLMVVFMLSNIEEIFKIPGALHKVVSEKLASLAQGKQPDVTGCQLSSPTHADSAKTTTNQELWALLNSIHLDPKISTKVRKRLLGQFSQAHPEVFHKYFGESAVGIL